MTKRLIPVKIERRRVDIRITATAEKGMTVVACRGKRNIWRICLWQMG